MSLKSVATELEFFIKGLTDKRWLQQKGNHIWDDWANAEIVLQKYSFLPNELENSLNRIYKEYLKDKELMNTKRLQDLFSQIQPFFLLENNVWKQNLTNLSETQEMILARKVRRIANYVERDLGPIYGFQWRHFGAKYVDCKHNYYNKGFDQLAEVLELLEKEPTSRRMIISAWNPEDKSKMALDPCHYSLQLNIQNNKLNLLWNQRSVDFMLGFPYNLASYALLTHLLASQFTLEAGKVIGQLGNTHIYDNQILGAKQQSTRQPRKLPKLTVFTENILEWDSKFLLEEYNPHDKLEFPLAV